MAVSGVSSSRSIYGNRNVLTGLASGLDTESMIENAISAYKNKISTLTQKRTKTEWKQDAYRSIIDKMSAFSDKYASYNSANNLMSTSFFDQAVRTVAKGANKDMITASGRTSSNIEINRVKQLATASRYAISGSQIGKNSGVSADGFASAMADQGFELGAKMDVGTLTGSLTLAYGGSDARSYLSVNFDESKVFNSASELADEINKQLKEQTVTIGTKSYTGDELLKNVIQAKATYDGTIIFENPKDNKFFVSSASESVQENLLMGQKPGEDVDALTGSKEGGGITGETLKKSVNTTEYLSDTSMKITLDGVTKSIEMPTADEILEKLSDKKLDGSQNQYFKELKEKIKNGEEINSPENRQIRDNAFLAALQEKIDDAFGTLKDENGDTVSKLKVSDASTDKNGDGLQLKFEAGQKASTFTVQSDKGWAMGFGEDQTLTSYLKTSQTLKDLVDLDDSMAVRDEEGRVVKENAIKDADGKITGYEGKTLYSFKINGTEVGQYTEDTALSTIINNINSNKDAGVNAIYSKTTNEMVFTARETGAAEGISMDSELSKKLFGDTSGGTEKDGVITYANGATLKKGQDAIFGVSINGGEEIELTRSGNSVEFDGLTVNLKGTFGYDEAGNKVNTEKVSFETNSDSDKIVDAIKAMVDDYNAMVTEIKNAYSTLPTQRSNGRYYEPLTEEDKEGMTESAIQAWEDKAKTGILFGDRDLSTLYKRLTSAVSMAGQDGADLKAAGITVSYSNGLSTLKLDEKTLRETLDSDPDRVRDIFTNSKESGAKTNGLMQSLKAPLDQYGKTTGGKGILVDKAGSVLAPSTLYTNTIQKELNNIDTEIEKWQDKMSDQVDYYTQQFSRLEQLVQQMNSQSSYFSQLMTGG